MNPLIHSTSTMPTGNAAPENAHNVQRVETAEQMAAVGRLRYRVYVEEMGRNEPHANHECRAVIDPTDTLSTVLASFNSQGEATGTVRYDHFKYLSNDDRRFHFIDTLPPGLQERSSITCKLITDKSYRRGTLTNRLVLGIFYAAHKQGISVNFINCNPPLDKFFGKLGFVPIGEPRSHPIYGSVRIMMVPMHDLDYLASIRSPFTSPELQVVPDEKAASATRDWCKKIGHPYWK